MNTQNNDSFTQDSEEIFDTQIVPYESTLEKEIQTEYGVASIFYRVHKKTKEPDYTAHIIDREWRIHKGTGLNINTAIIDLYKNIGAFKASLLCLNEEI